MLNFETSKFCLYPFMYQWTLGWFHLLPIVNTSGQRLFLFFFFNIYLFILRERARAGEEPRERERERIPSRRCALSTEPSGGLWLTNCEILTKSQTINRLSHPGALKSFFKTLLLIIMGNNAHTEVESLDHIYIYIFFLSLFILKARECKWEEGQRQREGKRRSQAGSQPSAWSPTWGSNSRTRRLWPEPKSDTQPTEPPRCPLDHICIHIFNVLESLHTIFPSGCPSVPSSPQPHQSVISCLYDPVHSKRWYLIVLMLQESLIFFLSHYWLNEFGDCTQNVWQDA